MDLTKPYARWDEIVYSSAIMGLLQGLTGNFKASKNKIEDAIAVAKNSTSKLVIGCIFDA